MAGWIKFVNKLILRLEDGWSGWPPCNHTCPFREEWGKESDRVIGRWCTAGFEDGGRGHKPQKLGSL